MFVGNSSTRGVISRKRGTRNQRGGSVSITLIVNLLFAVIVILWLSVSAYLLLLSSSPTSVPANKKDDGKSPPVSTSHSNNNNNNNNNLVDRQQSKASQKVGNGSNDDAKVEKIVDMLVTLARMPSDELKPLLEGQNDPFHLETLLEGKCPYSSQEGGDNKMDWLPDRPVLSKTASKWYKEKEPGKHVVVYYEHLSKAGGTSFCKLAQSNMPRKEVPKYYCMPSEPGMPDARVGAWTTTKLQTYALEQEPNHRLVSNEWEPFNLDFLKHFQPTTTTTTTNQQQLSLLFVTSIRNPINRLLSAYKFWGILHNPSETKPSLEVFLKRHANRAARWKIMSNDFVANVARFNFATWKFSGGKLPVSPLQLDAEAYLTKEDYNKHRNDDEQVWLEAFETSIRTLSKFDLAIPMEYLSKYTTPLTDLMGWTNFDKSHVVPSGKVVNNEASSELSPQEYMKLWDSNKLDMILYYWTCAIYLARLHCP